MGLVAGPPWHYWLGVAVLGVVLLWLVVFGAGYATLVSRRHRPNARDAVPPPDRPTVTTAQPSAGTPPQTPTGQPGGDRVPAPKTAVRPWMIWVFLGWAVLVLGVAIVSHTADSWKLCDTSTVATPAASSVEAAVTDESVTPATGTTPAATSGTSTKVTATSSSTVTTTNCKGATAVQVALLLVPGLLVFVTALTTLDIAGLFKVSFREVEEKIDAQAKTVEDVAAKVEHLVQLGIKVHVGDIYDTAPVREGARDADDPDRVFRLDDVFAELRAAQGQDGVGDRPPAGGDG